MATPHQSPAVTASPQGEAENFAKGLIHKMKRILSLFLSIIMVLSLCVSNISVSASTGAEKIMIEKTNILVDLVDKEYTVDYKDGVTPATFSTVKSPLEGGTLKRGITFNITKNKNTVTSDTTTFSDSTIKCDYHTATGYMQIQCDWSITDSSFSTKSVSGDVKVHFSGRMYNTAEGIPSFEIKNYQTVALSSNEKLKANTWYTFDSFLDLTKSVSDFTVTFTEELSAASSAEGARAHSISKTETTNLSGYSYIRFRSGAAVGTMTYYDDLKLEYTEAPFEKAEIVSVGENNVVDGGQSVVSVELSQNIPYITKDHITITNTETFENIPVDSIVVSDGTKHTVDVTLSSNIPYWAEYELKIDADAFGEGSMQRTGDADAVAVTDISTIFETSKPAFATKGFEYSISGTKLETSGLVVNNSGTPKDVKLIFASFDAEGRPVLIAPTNYYDFNDNIGDNLSAEIPTAGAEEFNFFIIDNWTDKTPLLGVNDTVDEFAITKPSQAQVSCGTLSTTGAAVVIKELNHDTKKLSLNIDTRKGELTEGILLVYEEDAILSDGNLPVYMRAISTAADGTLAKDIYLPSDLAYGDYVVEFVSASLAESLEGYFTHYTPAELLEARKTEILTQAKSASTAAELKEALLGLDSSDIKVNNNMEIFGSDADMTDYNAVYNRENIFTRMLSTISGVADYNALVSLFEESARAQLEYEEANPTIMIENKTTLVDIVDKTYTLGNSGGYSTQQSPQPPEGRQRGVMFHKGERPNLNEVKIDNDTFGYPVIKYVYTYAAQASNVQLKWTGESAGFNYAALEKQVKVYYSGRTRHNVADAIPSWNLRSVKTLTMPEALKKDTWYKFESVLDLSKTTNNFIVTYTEETDSNPHVVTARTSVSSSKFTQYQIYTGIAANSGNIVYYDDLKLEYEDIPYEKAKITSVGSAGVAEGGQNVLSFELSNVIPGLTQEHIIVKNKETNEEIGAESITVSGEATQTVSATLSSNLASWAEYDLIIDSSAFGETSVQRIGRQDATPVTDITKSFTTTKPPFAAKSFSFTALEGVLTAKGLVANTTGTPKDMSFVFASFDSQGRIKAITSTKHAGFNNSAGEYLEASVSTEGTNKLNFFVIDDWSTRNPLFGASYRVNAQGSYLADEVSSSCEAFATSAPALSLGEFDYSNIKIAFNLDTNESKIIDGILFVYKNGEVLSETNLPSYAKSISTNADGKLKGEILLPSTLGYGAYTAEFVSDKLGSKATKTFRYYSPDEILANKRAAILADAKVSSSAEGLREVLIGVNSAGEQVNSNGDVFIKDADMTDYQKNLDKLNVFQRMLSSVSSLANYDALVNLFEACAAAQRADEIAVQKVQMVTDAKSSTNAAGLMKVILGINDSEMKVNTNFELISSYADMSVYNALKNKAAVFSHMISTVKDTADFADLVYRFEQAALTQKSKESTPSRPSSNNSSFGSSSTAMTETTPAPQPGSNQQSVAGSASKFSDMQGHWASTYVDALYNRGIMKGYEDGSFRGENSITRAELAKTLVEAFEIAMGEGKAFTDVASTSWYAQYVATAASAGIVTGFEDGSFAPDRAVTRQDAALMLYRALSIGRTLPIGYTFFTDDLDISDYASGAIRTLGDMGIVGGNADKQFLPLNSITRAEVATIICRALDYIESH